MFPAAHPYVGRPSDVYKREFAGGAWALLARFGGAPDDILNELNGEGIHRLENMMILAQPVHNRFDRLNLWLEAVDVSSVIFRPTFIRATHTFTGKRQHVHGSPRQREQKAEFALWCS
jgi:hypothetical protein